MLFFLCFPHLVDNYVKNVAERGRNLMCECTLPSLLGETRIKGNLGFVLQTKWSTMEQNCPC